MGGFTLFEDEEYLVRYKKGQTEEYPHTIIITETDNGSFDCVAILDMTDRQLRSFRAAINDIADNISNRRNNE